MINGGSKNGNRKPETGNRKLKTRKGQAVMEYLITYGLALFVILFVLAILVVVVFPSLKAPEACQFTEPGFTCNQKQHLLVADANNNVRLMFQLDNSQGRSVKVLGALCTDATPGNVKKADVEKGYWKGDENAIALASGQSLPLGGTDNRVDCITADGSPVVLSPNSNFKGTLAVVYRFANEVDVEGVPSRLAVATLSGTIQSED